MSSLFSRFLRRTLFACAVLGAVGVARSAAQTVAGQIIPADGGSADGLRLRVRASTFADSADVDSFGRFRLALPSFAADTVEISVRAADPLDERYYPAMLRVSRDQLADPQRLVLIPRRWTIVGGRYANQAVPIRLGEAFTPVCTGCSSFFRRGAPGAAVQSWPDEVFPLRVAFDRDPPAAGLTERDSVRFWGLAEDVERTVGLDLFRPVSYWETLPDGDGPVDVILVRIDPALRSAGLGVVISDGGDISYGVVRIQRVSAFGRPEGARLVAHELMHALGFGHTCEWRSVMADLDRCRALASPLPTPEDVAHAQLLRRVRALQRVYDARWGIGAAVVGVSRR